MRNQIIYNLFGDLSSIISKYDYYFEGKIKHNLEALGNVRSFLVISKNEIVVQLKTGLILYNLDTKTLLKFRMSSEVQFYKLYSGNSIVTYEYGYLKIWHFQALTHDNIYPSHMFNKDVGIVSNMFVLPDRRVALYGSDNYISIWNPYNDSVIRLEGHTNDVSCLLYIGNDILVSGSRDNTIKMWNLSSDVLIRTLTGHTIRVNTLDLYNNFVISSDGSGQVRIWDLNGQLVRSVKSLNILNKLLFVADRMIGIYKYIEQKYITIWNFNTGKMEVKTKEGKYDIFNIYLLPDNNIISNSDKELRIWDLEGKLVNGRNVNMNYGDQLFVMPINSSIKILVNSKGKLLGLE